MSDAQREELRRLADAATPGPWFTGGATKSGLLIVEDGRSDGLFPITAEGHEARYIAAMDPTTCLSLLASLSQAEAERDAARKAMQDWADGSAALMEEAERAAALAAENGTLRSKLDDIAHYKRNHINHEDADEMVDSMSKIASAAIKGAGT